MSSDISRKECFFFCQVANTITNKHFQLTNSTKLYSFMFKASKPFTQPHIHARKTNHVFLYSFSCTHMHRPSTHITSTSIHDHPTLDHYARHLSVCLNLFCVCVIHESQKRRVNVWFWRLQLKKASIWLGCHYSLGCELYSSKEGCEKIVLERLSARSTRLWTSWFEETR